MTWNKRGQFRSQQQALNTAKRTHCCTACRHQQPLTFDVCPSCGVEGMRVYFRSEKELGRAMTLILLQRSGKISQLKFLPKFDLAVEGTKICGYEADAQYVEDGKTVIEDSKPEGDFMTDTAKFKIALFNALNKKHGLSVRIVR